MGVDHRHGGTSRGLSYDQYDMTRWCSLCLTAMVTGNKQMEATTVLRGKRWCFPRAPRPRYQRAEGSPSSPTGLPRTRYPIPTPSTRDPVPPTCTTPWPELHAAFSVGARWGKHMQVSLQLHRWRSSGMRPSFYDWLVSSTPHLSLRVWCPVGANC